MTKLVRATAAALLFAAFAMPAQAQTTTAAGDLSLSQVEQRLSQQGFRVLEIERDDGRYEVKAFNSAGQCVELDVNRRSGDIIRTERDDDCHDDDDRRGRNR